MSFGWCFWHVMCYGCLLCGSRLLCSGTHRTELNLDTLTKSGLRDGGTRSKQVWEAPLCALCATECEADGLGETEVVERGLERIDAVDGGVTRQRWAEKEGNMANIERSKIHDTRVSSDTR